MAGTHVAVLAVAGPVAVAVAWAIVRIRRASIWVVMGVALGVVGIAAAVSGVVRSARGMDPWVAAAWGAGAGVALYAATALFMAIAIRWPPLARHTEGIYDQRRGIPAGAALAIATLVVAPGEELLWRGVVQTTLTPALGSAGAAAATWAAYIAANAFGWSIPIVLAATVGGAAWGALALWTGGVAASVACHAVWTGLMIVRPPVPARRP